MKIRTQQRTPEARQSAEDPAIVLGIENLIVAVSLAVKLDRKGEYPGAGVIANWILENAPEVVAHRKAVNDTCEDFIGLIGDRQMDLGSFTGPNPCNTCGHDTIEVLTSHLFDEEKGDYVEDPNGKWSVGCKACERSHPTVFAKGDTRESAVNAWNELNPKSELE